MNNCWEVKFYAFFVSWFYSLNKAKLYEISNPFLHKTIDDITSESPNIFKRIYLRQCAVYNSKHNTNFELSFTALFIFAQFFWKKNYLE